MNPGAPSRAAHVARALVLATVAMCASSVTHVLAGGHAPSGGGFVLVCAALGLMAVPLVGVTASVWRCASVLAVLQVLAHVGNELASAAGRSGGAAPEAESAAAVLAQHGHGARPTGGGAVVVLGGAQTSMVDASHGGLLPSSTMLAAHLLVAVALAAAFAHGQRSWTAALRLVRHSSARLAAAVRGAFVPPVRILPTSAVRPWPRGSLAVSLVTPRDVWSIPAPVRRGPPVGLL